MFVQVLDWPLAALSGLSLLFPLLGTALGGGGNDDEAVPENPHPVDPNAYKDDPDYEVVQAVLAGDGAAYRALVERYQSRIYGVCFGMLHNREDARDMAQEAFVKAYKNLHRFRFGSSFYTWLCRIAMNVSIDTLRRQKVRRTEVLEEDRGTMDEDSPVELIQHRGDPAKLLERKRQQARILAALSQLPEEQRQCVVLREMEGLAYKEIAEVMNIPEGTVMSRLFYARKKLQAILEGER
jgi:RNA polymerase sigma-70 factor (ECF subfamily)